MAALVFCVINFSVDSDIKIEADKTVQDSKELSGSEQLFSFIKAKSENVRLGNNFHQMELYVINKDADFQEIKSFCQQKKSKFLQDVSTFSYVVFFDNKANAEFPANPLGAGFNDEASSRHIKAIYTFNRINGYSKLSFYEKNSWESLGQEIDI